MATPLVTLRVNGLADACSQLTDLVAEYKVCVIVVGLPLHMNGSRGEMADEAEQLGTRLGETTDCHVDYWDERMSSQAATRALRETGKRVPREAVDRVAACLILETYLSAHRP